MGIMQTVPTALLEQNQGVVSPPIVRIMQIVPTCPMDSRCSHLDSKCPLSNEKSMLFQILQLLSFQISSSSNASISIERHILWVMMPSGTNSHGAIINFTVRLVEEHGLASPGFCSQVTVYTNTHRSQYFDMLLH